MSKKKATKKSKKKLRTITRAEARAIADKSKALLQIVGSWKSAGVASMAHKRTKAKYGAETLPVVLDEGEYIVMYTVPTMAKDAAAPSSPTEPAKGSTTKKRARPAKDGGKLAAAKPGDIVVVKAKGGIRAKVYGMSGVAFVKWLGARGVNFKVARGVCDGLGVSIADPTIRASLPQGKRTPALKKIKLSADGQKKVEALLQQHAATTTKKAA